ncbi:MAG: S1 RNA-binding domain-containing protein, partial [Alphaproteobacteria bacterium]|nr:S1 RNA-binding domain-containing protein [Alphaproteobacteria bacterium]
YQHDINQTRLARSLEDTVMSCVNAVGVEVNTASKQLLAFVSGVGPALAKNIIDYRNQSGAYKTREHLTKVPRFGPKAFEQAAGFLRIANSKNPLDKSAVHPESYHIVEKMAQSLGVSVTALIENQELREKINIEDFVTEQAGIPTLQDIMAELARPGRDPRETFEQVGFREDVCEITDLQRGMELNGIVTNVTAFGAFVDIGGLEGMIHISQLAFGHVKHPSEILSVGQSVEVSVLRIEPPSGPKGREKIALSIRALARDPWQEAADSFPVGQRLSGKVSRLQPFGAFVELAPGIDGLVHISELGVGRRVNHPSEVLNVGDSVEATVLGVDSERRRISLSLDETKAGDAGWQAPGGTPDAPAAEAPEKTMGSFGALLQASLKKNQS